MLGSRTACEARAFKTGDSLLSRRLRDDSASNFRTTRPNQFIDIQ